MKKKPTPTKKPKIIKPKGKPRSDPIRQRQKRELPDVELGLTVDLTFHFSAGHPSRSSDITIKGSKPFTETPVKDHIRLFEHKVNECMKLCDFSDSSKDQKAKVTKTQLLKHIDSCFTRPELLKNITPQCIKILIDMISVNIFRRLPNNPIRGPLDAHDSVIDDGWPHISLVYNCLFDSFACSSTGSFITQSFIYKLIENGTSLFDEERARVAEILKAIYYRYMDLRSWMRKSLGHYFIMKRCSSELLQFYNICIDGFNVPLKPEHVKFFNASLIPLHSYEKLVSFHKSLVVCISKVIGKQGALIGNVFKYMQSHWPCSDRPKQLAFLNEVEVLLLNHHLELNQDFVKSAFTVIQYGSYNDNSDIVDKSIDILTNPKLLDIMMKYSSVIFPLVCENLLKSAKSHWDSTITANAMLTLNVINEMDPDVFRKVNESRMQLTKTKKLTLSTWNSKWLKIFDSAKSFDPEIKSLNFDSLKKPI